MTTRSTSELVTRLCACPDCSGTIGLVHERDTLLGLFCTECDLVFPVKNDIPILLPRHARSDKLETPLLEALISVVSERYPHLVGALANTLQLTRSSPGDSWEWEDEVYWTEKYSQDTSIGFNRDWRERMLERKPLVSELFAEVERLADSVVLEIGCGEGQTFRQLIRPYCDPSTVYVAVDISMAALELNRSRNIHPNSLYVLGTASKLPFGAATIDVLCYWGILHHCEFKSRSLGRDVSLLKDRGYVLLYEAVARLTVNAVVNKPAPEQSAHEERIDRSELVDTIESLKDTEILLLRSFHSAFYSAVFGTRLCGPVVARPWLYRAVVQLDQAFVKVLGPVIPVFQPAAVVTVLRQQRPSAIALGGT